MLVDVERISFREKCGVRAARNAHGQGIAGQRGKHLHTAHIAASSNAGSDAELDGKYEIEKKSIR